MMKMESQKKKLKYDVIVIGAGASGITACIYLKRAGINPLLIEKDVPGGMLNKISKIDNYPGYLANDGPSLAYNMYSQINEFNIELIKEEVLNIKQENDNLKVITNKESYFCRYIILASGKVPRKLGLPNEDKYIGKGISYCALCDGSLYKNKDIIVVGAGNASMQACKYLSNIVNKIYVLNRGDKLRADEKEINEVKKLNNVEILYNSSIDKINSLDGKITSVQLTNDNILNISGIFVYIGNDINSSYYQNLNLKQDKKGLITDSNMKTSNELIYAVGDSVSKDLYQVINAASEGMLAAVNIIKKLK